MITLHRYTNIDALPPAALALMRDDTPGGVFLGQAWFRAVLAHAMPAGAMPLFLVVARADRPLGLLALRLTGSQAESLTTPYSCAFAPLLAGELDHTERAAIGIALAHACRSWPVLRLDALDPDDPRVTALEAGACATGLSVRRFAHFGNWHEDVAGLSWPNYLARRSSQLRNTIRRKLAAAGGNESSLTILDGPAGLEAGIAAYEDVYARSWKQPEPFPDFNAALMRVLAPLGQLRLGLLRQDGAVIAAQIWLVANGTATVVKLAHDEAYKSVSPGTVLTAYMLHRLLDQEHVRDIDFGRGDDPYKQGWASQRRQKTGLLLIDPRKPAGLATLGRDMLGRAIRCIYKRRKPAIAG